MREVVEGWKVGRLKGSKVEEVRSGEPRGLVGSATRRGGRKCQNQLMAEESTFLLASRVACSCRLKRESLNTTA